MHNLCGKLIARTMCLNLYPTHAKISGILLFLVDKS